MIRRVDFQKRMNVAQFLKNHTDGVYAVDSMVKGVWYAADNKKFSIIRSKGAVLCTIDEMPELAQMIADKVIKEEISDIYEDLQDLSRMRMVYKWNCER